MTCEEFPHLPLADLVKKNKITEIIINGFQSIHFEEDGTLKSSERTFESERDFQSFIQDILEESQVKIDLENPFVSFLWRGFRVHICHPPLSKENHLVTMRRIHHEENFYLEELEQNGFLRPDQLEILKNGVKKKKNFLIVGGTGSGKTTTLSALLKIIDEKTRIVILEDTDEVLPPNPLSVKLLTREATPVLKKYDLGDLLKESLRMRPDRIVVGEVRGGEAKDLLLSLSTGHQGSFATLHASSANEALLRLEMLVQMGAPHWSIDSIRKLIALTVDWIVVAERSGAQRRIEGIYEITSLESIGFLTQKICDPIRN